MLSLRAGIGGIGVALLHGELRGLCLDLLFPIAEILRHEAPVLEGYPPKVASDNPDSNANPPVRQNLPKPSRKSWNQGAVQTVIRKAFPHASIARGAPVGESRFQHGPTCAVDTLSEGRPCPQLASTRTTPPNSLLMVSCSVAWSTTSLSTHPYQFQLSLARRGLSAASIEQGNDLSHRRACASSSAPLPRGAFAEDRGYRLHGEELRHSR